MTVTCIRRQPRTVFYDDEHHRELDSVDVQVGGSIMRKVPPAAISVSPEQIQRDDIIHDQV